MAAPHTIDLAGGSVAWPAFVLSGVTGVTALNTSYALRPFDGDEYVYVAASGHRVRGGAEGGEWTIDNGALTGYFVQECVWPWEAAGWNASGGAGGTLVFTRAVAAPGALDLTSGGATVPATLSTNLAGNNNDLAFTSKLSGRLGNAVRVRYVSPGTNNAALGVAVSGLDITVNLATNGSAAITTTAAQVKTAMEANGAAAALVTVANKVGNDGSGVATAMGWTSLTGGAGGLPLPPGVLAL